MEYTQTKGERILTEYIIRTGVTHCNKPKSDILNPHVAMAFLNVRCNWRGGVNYPSPGISRVLCHYTNKIPNIITMFLTGSFSTVPMPTFTGDSFTPKFKMAPKNRK